MHVNLCKMHRKLILIFEKKKRKFGISDCLRVKNISKQKSSGWFSWKQIKVPKI